MRSAAIIGLIAAALSLATLCASADADVFGPLSLLSATPTEQADYAHDPAISADGRYVVFDGSIDGLKGVWRREIGGADAVLEVAGGDAELPSVSENGQYVSFTTNEGGQLPAITNGQIDPEPEARESPNVYVRNMNLAPSEAGAFIVASAATGSTEPLTYGYPPTATQAERERYGATAVGRSAISADGQEVVFTTTATSDLTDPGTPEDPTTPPLQVAVRNFQTETTELVTVKDDPATGRPETNEAGQPLPVPLVGEGTSQYGAVYKAIGGIPSFLPPPAYSPTPQIGASISADGSTVAWLGQNLADQVQALAGEPFYVQSAEPLWRRIGAGESAVTRPVTGGADLFDPECAADPDNKLPSPPSLSDPCQGPFDAASAELDGTGISGDLSENEVDAVPRLSENGDVVAFLADAPLVALGQGFGLHRDDLYVSSMQEGLPRVQALTPLTELASGAETQIATTAQILDFDISPDGQQVAFTTERTVFPLGSPNYVSVPAATPGLSEMFDVDLADDTLTRVTHGYEGSAGKHPTQGKTEDPYGIGDGALSPSFSRDGNTLVFSSTASNFVFGDGNTPPLDGALGLDGSDVYAVPRYPIVLTPTSQTFSEPPPQPILQPLWMLGVTAASQANGTVRLYVETPASGTLQASARSAVTVESHLARHPAAHAKGRPASRVTATVLTRTVARASHTAAPGAAGLNTLVLTLAPYYASLAARRHGLSATVDVTFTAPGHPALSERIEVDFLRAKPAARPRAAAARSRIKAHSGRR